METTDMRLSVIGTQFDELYRLQLHPAMNRAVKEANRQPRGTICFFEAIITDVAYIFGDGYESISQVDTAIYYQLLDVIDRIPNCKIHPGTVYTNWKLDETSGRLKLNISVRLIREP